MLYIGETDRRGKIIDFRVPPVIVDSPRPISDQKKAVFREHISAERLSMDYGNPKNFMVLRPTALPYRSYVRERLQNSDLSIYQEFSLCNFMQFADSVYQLNPQTSFHWQWRVIMRSMHETGIQDQNTAFAFILKSRKGAEHCHAVVTGLKNDIRRDMGEIPVIVRYKGRPKIALGIHHVHSPEIDRVSVEYNALMHAKNKTLYNV